MIFDPNDRCANAADERQRTAQLFAARDALWHASLSVWNARVSPKLAAH